MKLHSSLLRRSRRAGFSLAEVTIATGITALALTTLLGLIPEGLKNIKQAGDLAAETRITSHILGIVSQAKWQPTPAENQAGQDDPLQSLFDEKRYFFDDQGVAIESETPGPELAYVAQVRMPDKNVTLPASGELGSVLDPYLRRVTVNVASVANENFDFVNALPMAYRSHTTLIARTGK